MPADVRSLVPSPLARAIRRRLRSRLDVDAIEQAWRQGTIGTRDFLLAFFMDGPALIVYNRPRDRNRAHLASDRARQKLVLLTEPLQLQAPVREPHKVLDRASPGSVQGQLRRVKGANDVESRSGLRGRSR